MCRRPGSLNCADEGGWGRSADRAGRRGGSPPLDFKGVTKAGACAGIAGTDEVSSTGDSDGVAVVDRAFGENTCCVDGGLVQGVDREQEEAGPDDTESCDISGECDGVKAPDDVGVPPNAGREGTMVASGDVDTRGDADFGGELLVAASRALSRNSCRMSSLLRAFGESLSPALLVGDFASCLFVELVDSVRGFMIFEGRFCSCTLASCFF